MGRPRKYLEAADFVDVYKAWQEKGKPRGNDETFLAVWDGVTNAVKACIGKLQTRYGCKYSHYDEKVLDTTMIVIEKLFEMPDYPKNIVTYCYFPTLSICCGRDAKQLDFEDNMEDLPLDYYI